MIQHRPIHVGIHAYSPWTQASILAVVTLMENNDSVQSPKRAHEVDSRPELKKDVRNKCMIA